MANEQDVEYVLRPTKSAVAAVFLGITLILLAFFTYRYFNRAQNPEIGSGVSTVNDGGIPNLTYDNSTGGNAGTDIRETPTQSPTPSIAGQQGNKPLITSGATQAQAGWVATDYKKGDIKTGSYTVKAGDTLWEIAEAVYGNGSEWGKILTANQGKIGFLPSGSQALISTGQTLTIP